MRTILMYFVAFAILAWSAPSLAVLPSEMLSNPLLEKRAREISKGLRCLVCQNQSIDDSNAGLAKDLRIIVRERLVAGDSDTMVLRYIVARYGDFVLLKPPFKGATLVLWLGPGVIASLGLFAMISFLRRRRTAGPDASRAVGPSRPPPLTVDEKRQVEKLMKNDEA